MMYILARRLTWLALLTSCSGKDPVDDTGGTPHEGTAVPFQVVVETHIESVICERVHKGKPSCSEEGDRKSVV